MLLIVNNYSGFRLHCAFFLSAASRDAHWESDMFAPDSFCKVRSVVLGSSPFRKLLMRGAQFSFDFG